MALDYDKDYVVNLVKGIREAQYLCDVTLIAGLDKRRFPVHRNVMIASSPFFKAMLGPNFMDANEKEVILGAMNSTTLNIIINYCYSGTVRINKKNVDAIMAAASCMELVQLEEKCVSFYLQHLNVGSCVNVLSIADGKGLVRLRNKAFFLICTNFDEIPIADMVKLDEKVFGEILEEEKIAVAETEIFDRFVQWVEHDQANRSKSVASLAKSIRLEHLPNGFLSERVESFYAKHGCDAMATAEQNKRKPNHIPDSLHRYQPGLYLADFRKPGEIAIIKYFEGEWEDHKTISISSPRKSCTFFNGKAYFCDSLSMESYDLITSKTETMADLPVNVYFCSPMVIGKYTYILGKTFQQAQDKDDVSIVNCYRFDKDKNAWEIRESLPQNMANASVVELDGLIYVTGKIKKSQNHASNFWCYDPNRNVWTEKAHTNLNAELVVLVKVDGSICICQNKLGFYKYAVALDRWTKMNFKPPVLWKSITANYDYYLHDAVELENTSYGLMETSDGQLFFEICMKGNRCEFEDEFFSPLEQWGLGISGEYLHLFVR